MDFEIETKLEEVDQLAYLTTQVEQYKNSLEAEQAKVALLEASLGQFTNGCVTTARSVELKEEIRELKLDLKAFRAMVESQQECINILRDRLIDSGLVKPKEAADWESPA